MYDAFKIAKGKLEGKFTVAEAFKHFGISQSAFVAYKNGSTPSLPMLIKISKLSGVNIDWMVTGKGPKFSGDIGHGKVQHITDGSLSIAVEPMLINIEPADSYRFDYVLDNESLKVTKTGDIVIVNLNDNHGEGYFLIEIDNERFLREVQIKENDKLLLLSSVGKHEFSNDECKILGRVIWRSGRI